MQVNRTACCDQVNRGVAVNDGRVYVGALDGMLYALELGTGNVAWQVDTIDGDDRGQTITGAPEVAGGVVVIGNGGAEYGTRGYVSAYDLASGELKWRFYTVPRDPALGPQEHPELEAALDSWGPGTRWEMGLGGTVWDAIHYDEAFDAVYIGVGNGAPYHSRRRSPSGGDQLYLSSLIALDPATGRMKWYYQETPAENWDYTATAPMVLTTLTLDGEDVPVLMHAPKNGFLYLFDRRDGALLRAHSLVFQNWTDGIDPETGRPAMRDDLADYSTGPKIVYPATPGARNWHPASFNPGTGLYYAAVQELGNLMFMPPQVQAYERKGVNHDAALVYTSDLVNLLPAFPPPLADAIRTLPEWERVVDHSTGSALRAIDPLTGETRWSVSTSSWQDRAGVLSTAGGLVFYGDATGRFSAFDADNGKRRWSVDTGTSIMAAPMTYAIDGVQYVAVMAGWGGGGWPYVPKDSAAYRYDNRGRLLVFRLGGGEVPLPRELPPLTVAPEAPPQLEGVSHADLASGRELFMKHCTLCHANQQRTPGADLRRMAPETHAIFDEIVLGGALVPLGMPRWDDLLSDADSRNLHAFLIAEQEKVHAFETRLAEEGKPLDSNPGGVLAGL
jgi:quinohemoprotein ethanol dehydrogenase